MKIRFSGRRYSAIGLPELIEIDSHLPYVKPWEELGDEERQDILREIHRHGYSFFPSDETELRENAKT